MTSHKVKSLSALKTIVSKAKRKKQRIVFTNGTFDLLHIGHVTYLEKARALGDCLIVGVNSDGSVKSYKGPSRPINPQSERMKVLAALECVSHVVLFNDPTPLKLIKSLKPDVLVKGGDWEISNIVGANEVHSWGGTVKVIPYVQDRSSTRLIKLLDLS